MPVEARRALQKIEAIGWAKTSPIVHDRSAAGEVAGLCWLLVDEPLDPSGCRSAGGVSTA
jgi:hypothetical protein